MSLPSDLRSRSAKRRRWICNICDTTFGTNTGTPYHRLHGSRGELDAVVVPRVEGLCKSAIARATGRAWNTVARWLGRASTAARKFDDEKLKGFELLELQVDQLCTFVGRKENPPGGVITSS